MTADVAYLDGVRAEPFFVDLKRDIMAQLEPAPGDRILDIGCGTGEDVTALAGLVGNDGIVLGVDRSADMIEQAKLRSVGQRLPVGYQVADAHRLPIGDGFLSACRTERTLQHVADPAAVVAEVHRVLAAGGRFVAAEPDWGTTLVAPDRPSVANTILARWTAFNRNPTIGRDLCGLLRRAGFDVIRAMGRAVIYPTFEAAIERFPLEAAAAYAVSVGLVTSRDAEAWIGNLRQASAEGTFFFAITMFTVFARKRGR